MCVKPRPYIARCARRDLRCGAGYETTSINEQYETGCVSAASVNGLSGYALHGKASLRSIRHMLCAWSSEVGRVN